MYSLNNQSFKVCWYVVLPGSHYDAQSSLTLLQEETVFVCWASCTGDAAQVTSLVHLSGSLYFTFYSIYFTYKYYKLGIQKYRIILNLFRVGSCSHLTFMWNVNMFVRHKWKS